MNLLVLATDYPDDLGYIKLMYIHTRNKYYITNGHSVTVLNFSAKHDYTLDGVNVVSKKSFDSQYENFSDFDILILHAANIRNHYRFLKSHDTNDIRKVFFYHGHEIMRINEIYPKPYAFDNKTNPIKTFMHNQYDGYKISLWNRYLKRINETLNLVFVSQYLKSIFMTNFDQTIGNKHKLNIIHNAIGSTWETNSYNREAPKQFDFITIRSSLDASTYSIDTLVKWASNNPSLKFLLIGKGEFFNYFDKPNNIVHIDKILPHEDLINYITESRVALMPTRHDTQGVMSCELATFGIPLITSDIEVTREIFNNFPNVELIDNNSDGTNLLDLQQSLTNNYIKLKDERYFAENTMAKELKLFSNIIDDNSSMKKFH